jgi:hypothetical protein
VVYGMAQVASLWVAQAQIAPPGAVFSLPGESRIAPPGQSQKASGSARETPEEREERLIEKDIVAPPPLPLPPPEPPKEKPKGLDAVLEKMKSEGLSSGENAKPAFVRSEIDFGSWWALRNPEGTSFVPDFSYGGSILFFADLASQVHGEGVPRNIFGLGFVTYNAGTFSSTNDLWGGKSDVYAESNAMELGLWGGVIHEIPIENTAQHISWDFRLGYFPMKWVKAISYTDMPLSSESEANTHFAWGWMSFGASAGVSWGWGGFFDVGPFVSVQTSNPFQVRARAGLKISMQGR